MLDADGLKGEERERMYLCNYCRKGQVEMCLYFKEHFLEECEAVKECPEFEEEIEELSLFDEPEDLQD